jgi:murein endopeptidase
MSQPRGGPLLSEHTSHQIGLDVDIWFAPMPDHVQSREERELGPGTDVVAPGLRDVDPKLWTHAHTALIRTTAQDPVVVRILVNAAIKKALCREAGADHTWLYKGASLVWSRRAFSCPNRLSGRQCGMQSRQPRRTQATAAVASSASGSRNRRCTRRPANRNRF